MTAPVTPVAPPPQRPPLTQPQPSEKSRALSEYYARSQAELLSQGLLRTDGGTDVPLSQRQLVENFVRIGLYDEYDLSSGVPVARQSASKLRRWDSPVRINVFYGDTVPTEQRRTDQASFNRYIRRLSRVTGAPVSQTSTANANFHVFVVNEDELRGLGPELKLRVPNVSDATVRSITTMPRNNFCWVYAFIVDGSASYYHAVAVIRAEQPDLLRQACIHEELAQGMGLTNDSRDARPSIFNDDEEFALLTKHDEMLLRMLYDDRLRTGMLADEARPILQQIAAEMMGGAS